MGRGAVKEAVHPRKRLIRHRGHAPPRQISDSGDHLHPADAGYRAMAEAVDIAPLIH